jgi:predicted amidophosphoribosyltransferase
MALVSCPDCGSQISTMAWACPKCGRPMRSAMRYFGKRALILWALLIIMFFVIWQFMNAHH